MHGPNKRKNTIVAGRKNKFVILLKYIYDQEAPCCFANEVASITG